MKPLMNIRLVNIIQWVTKLIVKKLLRQINKVTLDYINKHDSEFKTEDENYCIFKTEIICYSKRIFQISCLKIYSTKL